MNELESSIVKFHPEAMDIVLGTRNRNEQKGKGTAKEVAEVLIHMIDTETRFLALLQTRLEAVKGTGSDANLRGTKPPIWYANYPTLSVRLAARRSNCPSRQRRLMVVVGVKTLSGSPCSIQASGTGGKVTVKYTCSVTAQLCQRCTLLPWQQTEH